MILKKPFTIFVSRKAPETQLMSLLVDLSFRLEQRKTYMHLDS